MKTTDSQSENLRHAIQQDADSCVMCGMCQPHCPTYQVYSNEAESPRGRIAIIQAYAQGRIAQDDSMLLHLEHCLGCMACEAMCPSNVAYGRLIDNALALLAPHKTKVASIQSTLLKKTAIPGGLQRYTSWLRWYNITGLQLVVARLLRFAGMKYLLRLNNVLGLADTTSLKTFYPAIGPAKGNLALFTGCMGTSFDATTLLSSIKVVTHLGYNLHIPAGQHCCGALHQHLGQPNQSRQLAQQNQSIFGGIPITHILFTANGCGAQLAQANLPVPVMDIVSFILSSPFLEACHFKPLNEHVFIHESCSSINKIKIRGAMYKLLKCIPQLQFVEADSPALCCGAGSTHSLLFPDMANTLAQLKISKIENTRPRHLLSDNLGCGLHLKNTFKNSGLEVEVFHPITLLARQLD